MLHANLTYDRLPESLRRELEYTDRAGRLCPPRPLLFRALELTPLNKVKVVILGQDPYHTPGKASGLAFGYRREYRGPVDASLRNIIKEVEADIGYPPTTDRTLESWAHQGVLLLNSKLSTVEGHPNAHAKLGWEQAVFSFLERLQDDNANMVFMLWGNNSKEFSRVVNEGYNLLLTSSHPSPLSYTKGFKGCKHFSKANSFLIRHGREPIVW